jgi:hypothetical protein
MKEHKVSLVAVSQIQSFERQSRVSNNVFGQELSRNNMVRNTRYIHRVYSLSNGTIARQVVEVNDSSVPHELWERMRAYNQKN